MKKSEPRATQTGVVWRSTGSWYSVRTGSGDVIPCKLKGKFRLKGLRTTNPIAVGDRVDFIYDPKTETGVITGIHERENYVVRKATKLSKSVHIIAANVDQVVLIVSLIKPRTSTGFIDRFLVTTEAYHIPATIVFNKKDLYQEEQFELLNEYIRVYESAGYDCLVTSAKTGENVERFKTLLKGKLSLLSGHSGVGKSALINAVDPALNLKEGEISKYHEKGKHTTTFAEMFSLQFGGRIIDTPGIKEFGLVGFDKYELGQRFPEFREKMFDCRFNDCLHRSEPGCAVRKAVENGEISAFRYKNYLNILKDLEEEAEFG